MNLRGLITDLFLRRFRVIRDVTRWACARHADTTALETSDGYSLCFTELGADVCRLARGMLVRGVKPCDNVAFTLPNTPSFVLLRLACYEAGIAAVPLAADLAAEHRRRILADTKSSLYFHDPVLDPSPPNDIPGLESVSIASRDHDTLKRFYADDPSPLPAPVHPDDIATINFTSGTTGDPKGVLSTQSAWVTSFRMTARGAGLTERGRETMLHAIPLATAGWGALFPCMAGGITSVLSARYDPAEILRTIAAARVTRTLITPSQLADILDSPQCASADLSSLRMMVCGTAPLPASLASKAIERFGPVLYQGYGLAEVLPPLSILPPGEFDAAYPFRVGRPVPGVDVRIVDNVVHVKSPTQSAGYFNRPDLTERAFVGGYFDTGDIGYLDEAGYLNIIGRKSDRIEGMKLHPREVEEVVAAHPAVKECAVIESDGHPSLVYSMCRNADAAPDEIRSLVSDRLPDVIVDRIVPMKGDLPRTYAGKVVRSALQRALAQRASPPASDTR